MFWEKTHSWIERKWKLILIPSVWMNFLSISNEQIFYHNNKEIKQNIYLTGMPNLKIIIEQYVFSQITTIKNYKLGVFIVDK